MFLIGFMCFYLIVLITLLIVKCSEKISYKIGILLDKGQKFFYAFIFTILSFAFTLFYILFSINVGSKNFGAMLCAFFLVFTWFLIEFFYKLIAGERVYGYNQKNILTDKDKNVCTLVALITIVISGLKYIYKYTDSDYYIMISIAISIWIGSYISISDIYKGASIFSIIKNALQEFKSNKTVWVSSIIGCIIIILIMSINPDVILKIVDFITECGLGFVVGSVSFIFVIVIKIGILNKK